MVADIRMIWWMRGYTTMNRVRNKVIRDLIKVVSIEDKMREIRLKWLGHAKRMSVNVPMRRCERINILNGKKERGQPKKSLNEVIRNDLKVVGLTEDMAKDMRL